MVSGRVSNTPRHGLEIAGEAWEKSEVDEKPQNPFSGDFAVN